MMACSAPTLDATPTSIKQHAFTSPYHVSVEVTTKHHKANLRVMGSIGILGACSEHVYLSPVHSSWLIHASMRPERRKLKRGRHGSVSCHIDTAQFRRGILSSLGNAAKNACWQSASHQTCSHQDSLWKNVLLSSSVLLCRHGCSTSILSIAVAEPPRVHFRQQRHSPDYLD